MSDLDRLLADGENIQPVRGGRSVARTLKVLNPSKKEKEDVDRKIEEHERNIRVSSTIDAYLLYVKFMVETFPTSRGEAHKIRERAVNYFDGDTRYVNDDRYVQLWLDYIDGLERDTRQIDEWFGVMQKKGIGVESSKRYDVHAAILMNDGRFTRALAVLGLGIANVPKGEGRDKLIRRRIEFERLMKEDAERLSQASANGVARLPSTRDENGNEIGALVRRRLKAMNMKQGQGQSRGMQIRTNGNSGFVAHADTEAETGAGAGTGTVGLGFGIGRERDRVKENTQPAERWVGGLGVDVKADRDDGGDAERGGAGLSRTKSSTASFPVFRDDDAAAAVPVHASTSATASVPVPVTEVCRDPDGRRPGEVPAYDTALLFGSGSELQFEEVRAAAYPYVPIPVAETDDSFDGEQSGMDIDMEETEFVVSRPPSHEIDRGGGLARTPVKKAAPVQAPIQRKIVSTPLPPTPTREEIESTKGRLSFKSEASDEVEATTTVTEYPETTYYGAGPSPTIKTKLALNDVLGMFSGNLDFDEDGTVTAHGLTMMLNPGFKKPAAGAGAGASASTKSGTAFTVFTDAEADVEPENDTSVAPAPGFTVFSDPEGEPLEDRSRQSQPFQIYTDDGNDNENVSARAVDDDVSIVICPTPTSSIAPAMFDLTEQNSVMNSKSIDIASQGKVYMGAVPYYVGNKIEGGGYASIHVADVSGVVEMYSEIGSDQDLVVKIQSPPCTWEFYMANQVRTRVDSSLQRCFVPVHSLHIHNNKSAILMDRGDGKSLQTAVNTYRLSGQTMDETLVMFYACEAARIIEGLHAASILNCDIKPDNFLIRMEDTGPEWGVWTPARVGPWAGKGLQLIDFGCAADGSLYPRGTLFTGSSDADSFRCPSMVEGRPWGTNQDLYGLASTIHFMLFGEYMAVEQKQDGAGDSESVWCTKSKFKRYWQSEMWSMVFEALLNAEPELIGEEYTEHSTLRAVRLVLEECLSDAKRAKGLKTQLIKQNILLLEGAKTVEKETKGRK